MSSDIYDEFGHVTTYKFLKNGWSLMFRGMWNKLWHLQPVTFKDGCMVNWDYIDITRYYKMCYCGQITM